MSLPSLASLPLVPARETDRDAFLPHRPDPVTGREPQEHVALRSDPNDVKGVAVLAWTLGFDVPINALTGGTALETLGRVNSTRESSLEFVDAAVPVLVFFCPWVYMWPLIRETLPRTDLPIPPDVFGVELSETQDGSRSACRLNVALQPDAWPTSVDPLDVEARQRSVDTLSAWWATARQGPRFYHALVDVLERHVIDPLFLESHPVLSEDTQHGGEASLSYNGLVRGEATRIWEATMLRITTTLWASVRPQDPAIFSPRQTLYRGMRKRNASIFAGPEQISCAMQAQWQSTTRSKEVAMGMFTQDEGLVAEFIPIAAVVAIDVNSALGRWWSCYYDENEFILCPGHTIHALEKFKWEELPGHTPNRPSTRPAVRSGVFSISYESQMHDVAWGVHEGDPQFRLRM